MRHTGSSVAVSAVSLLGFGCAPITMIDSDAAPRFAHERQCTYAFADVPDYARDQNGLDAPLTDTARSAIAAMLERKGLQRDDTTGKADIVVLAWSTTPAPDDRAWGYAYAGARLGSMAGRAMTLTYEPRGIVARWTLVVDVLDHERRTILWRGLASMKASNGIDAGGRTSDVVARIMTQFPARDGDGDGDCRGASVQ